MKFYCDIDDSVCDLWVGGSAMNLGDLLECKIPLNRIFISLVVSCERIFRYIT